MTIVAPSPIRPPGTNTNPIFEVGQYFEAHTDFIGPFSAQAFWTTQVWLTSVPERYVMLRKYPCVGNTIKNYQWSVGLNDPATDSEGFGVRPITPGASAVFRVLLDDPAAGFHEEAQITGVMAQYDPQFRVSSNSTGQLGFTANDREELQVVASAVQVPLPISTVAGAVAQTALASFVSS